MGALHIEKASWTYVGQVEDGSRTPSLMADVNIKAIGVAESCLHSSHISRSRYLNTVSYHHLLLKPKLLVLQFVRSVRSSNKSLYLTSLIKTTYYFFALNHVHYARWTPVNIRDMIMLHISCILASIVTLWKITLPSAKPVSIFQILVLLQFS